MTSEATERDLVRALASLEDTRVDLLHTLDGFERLQVQLNRAGINVDQIADMTARGGQWTEDADFSSVILENVRADSREVGTALADLGITQNDVGRHLDDASEHLVQAREALASAAARAEYGPSSDETAAAIRTVRDRTQAASTNITAARGSLRHVDVSVASGQAFLSSPVTSPETARSVATGAQLHVSEAMTAATRSLDQIDGGRDRTTHSAADIAALTEAISASVSVTDPGQEKAPESTTLSGGSAPRRDGSTSIQNRRDDPRRDPGRSGPSRHI